MCLIPIPYREDFSSQKQKYEMLAFLGAALSPSLKGSKKASE